MFKRRTSKVRQRRQVRVLRASVMSPRIFWHDFRRALGGLLRGCVVIAILWLIGWGIWRGVRVGLLENDDFRLQSIELNENPSLDEIRLLELTGIDLEGSLFDCRPSRIQEQLEALPEIASAEVIQEFPGTLSVDVTVREPFVWVANESQGIRVRDPVNGLLVDRMGVLFPCAPGMWDEAKRLPVIVLGLGGEALEPGSRISHPDYDRGVRLYSEALAVSSSASEWIDQIRQYKQWGSQLTTRDDLVATFGHNDTERQMKDLMAAMTHAKDRGDRMATISLVGKRNMPVTFHEITPPKAIPVPEPKEETQSESDLRHLLER